MSGVAIDAMAQGFVRSLEDRESRTSGVSVLDARRVVARRTGIAAGTLENIRRGRIKGVRAWILDALRAALIRELEAEIRRDEHELIVLRASRRDGDHEQMVEVLASLEAKRKVLNGDSQ